MRTIVTESRVKGGTHPYGREPRPESQVFCVTSRLFGAPRARALWWPCSHPHVSWRYPASLTAAHCHVCLCVSVCHHVDVQMKMNWLKRKRDFCWPTHG